MDLPIAKLIKLAKMQVSCMRQIMLALFRSLGHTLITSTSYRTDVPFIACVINSPSTFTSYSDLSNLILESVL